MRRGRRGRPVQLVGGRHLLCTPERCSHVGTATPDGKDVTMKKLLFSAPTFGFVVGTRVALAFGLGLLAAEKLDPGRRRTIGLSLVGLGALTTIPAATALARAGRASRPRSAGKVER